MKAEGEHSNMVKVNAVRLHSADVLSIQFLLHHCVVGMLGYFRVSG